MLKTPLYEIHKNLGAKIFDFAGWRMPLQYTGVLDEHKVVREKCGLFDVSHMGEIKVYGEKAVDFIQHLITNDVATMLEGNVKYSLFCNHQGGVIDDFLIYRQSDNQFLLVVNAANVEKDYQWLKQNAYSGVKIKNISEQIGQLAIQGPATKQLMEAINVFQVDRIKRFNFITEEFYNNKVIISRTGYTGEDGFEIYINKENIKKLWNIIYEKGQKYGLLPVGLGARDALRLEKGYCLYGHELTEKTNPFEAGLDWLINFGKGSFIGDEALQKIKKAGVSSKLVGFKMIDKRIPRKNNKIIDNGETIGMVTSGCFSPCLGLPIGMGYIKKEKSVQGNEIFIKIRNDLKKARIVDLPFVK